MEQPLGLCEGLAGLDGDAGFDAGGGGFVLEIMGQKVAAKELHGVVDPAVVLGAVVPEVVVGVDAHGGLV